MNTSILLSLLALGLLSASDLLIKAETSKEPDTPVLAFFFYMSAFAFVSGIPLAANNLGQLISAPANLYGGFVIALFAVAAYGFYLYAFSGVPSTTNTTIFRLAIVPSIILAIVFLHESCTFLTIVGICCCIAAILTFASGDHTTHLSKKHLLFSLAGCLFSGAINPLTKYFALCGTTSAVLLLSRYFFTMLLSGALLKLRHIRFVIPKRALLYSAVGGVLLTAQTNLVLSALKIGQANNVMSIVSLSFVVSGVISALLSHEKFSWGRAVAMTLAATSILLIVRSSAAI